jgi:hypothetical protein
VDGAYVAADAQTCSLGHRARWTGNKEHTELTDWEAGPPRRPTSSTTASWPAFPEIDDVLSGTIEPSELPQGGSKTSLLCSSTTIRALASAWNDLRTAYRWTKTERPVNGNGECGSHRRRERRQMTYQIGESADYQTGEVCWIGCRNPLEDENPIVVQPRWAGLRAGPSFHSGENLTRVDALDVCDHIGWAHRELVGQIEDVVRLNSADRDSLRRGVHSTEAC